MLLVDGAKRVLWRYPGRLPRMPFNFDDDTFFGPRFDRIISNQEDQNTIQIVTFPGGRVPGVRPRGRQGLDAPATCIRPTTPTCSRTG